MSAENEINDFKSISRRNFEKVTEEITKVSTIHINIAPVVRKTSSLWKNIRFFDSHFAQIGYKDGIHDGRQSKYQRDFDEGYLIGFQSGFRRGNADGSADCSTRKSNGQADSNGSERKQTSKPNCILCLDKSLEGESVSKLIELQRNHNKTTFAEWFFTCYRLWWTWAERNRC